MENRKVVQLGRSTLVVSLPKKWANLNKLKRGDNLSLVIQQDGSLAVHAGALKKEDREITLDVDPDEEKGTLTRKIISCYLNGYFRINLISKDMFSVDQQKTIREIAEKLYLRIMKADAREVLTESLVDPSKLPPDLGIRRMHTIASSMCRDALKALEQHNEKLANVVCSIDDDVDRFSFLLLRMLRTATFNLTLADQMNINLLDCLDYQTVIHRIEQVADLAANISKAAIELHPKGRLPPFLLEPVLMAGHKACEMYERAVEAFFAKNAESANEIIGLEVEVEELNRKIIERTVGEKRTPIICVTCSIRDSITRIANLGADVAEVVINRATLGES